MAITWTAKLKDISGIPQVHWDVKDDSKTIGINGCITLNEDETTTEPLVDWTKTKLGDVACTEYEEESKTIDDTLPSYEDVYEELGTVMGQPE